MWKSFYSLGLFEHFLQPRFVLKTIFLRYGLHIFFMVAIVQLYLLLAASSPANYNDNRPVVGS